MINRHFYWHEKAIFQAAPSAALCYNEQKDRVIIVDKDSVFAYSMRYDEKTVLPLPKFPFARNAGAIACDDEKDLLYVYNLKQVQPDDPTLAVVNMKNLSIEYRQAQIPQLSHHNVLLRKENSGVYIFGGYEEHSYSNRILKYNPEADSWDSVEFTGDEIFPRYFSALGPGVQPSQILIMGGIGNESGKREHGVRHLYDLFSVDLETKQIKKLWDIKDKIQSDVTPCSNIVLDEGGKYFYTLCYPQYRENSVLQLYRFNMADGSYEIAGDTIHINTELIETSVYLFFSKRMQKFYAVIRENLVDGNANIRMYSLFAPPITASELKFDAGQLSFQPFLWMLLALVLILILILYQWKKQKEIIPEKLIQSEITEKTPAFLLPLEQKKNAAYFFGDFTVYDRNGREISSFFSPRLKEIFAFLLFYSIDGQTGVSTDTLTSALWPNKDSHDTKNTRGVTINRLRHLLKEISGITLFSYDSRWYFELQPTFYCDYVEYRERIKALNENNRNKEENMSRIYYILKRGSLTPYLQGPWIDAYKHKHENEIRKILWNRILKLYEENDYTNLSDYSEVFFNVDPLDEEVFKLHMYALEKMGRKPQAILLYNRFVSNYKELMGIEPDLRFINLHEFPFDMK
jgi:two-component SAPR family response regulator